MIDNEPKGIVTLQCVSVTLHPNCKFDILNVTRYFFSVFNSEGRKTTERSNEIGSKPLKRMYPNTVKNG